MSDLERLTVTVPAEMAAGVRTALEEGYASASEIVREALRDWQMKHRARRQELAALKTDIAHGMADIAAGRVSKFNAGRIARRGRALSDGRTTSG